MRLGGFFDASFSTPDEWVAIHKTRGYTAAYAPYRVPPGGAFPGEADLAAYRQAAEAADIVIAEVGAWGRNFMSEDDRERHRAVDESILLLDMAEKLGARCLVNSAGWCRNPAEAFSEVTFRRIVDTAQGILDAVKPKHACLTLELVPDIYPYSVDSYVELVKAVDRAGFGVHFDLANAAATPYLCYHSAELIGACVDKLGPLIRSCHAKDVTVTKGMVVHIDEVRPGLGCLDYPALIHAMNALDPDMPLMMEHLSGDREYLLAAEYIRSCGDVR